MIMAKFKVTKKEKKFCFFDKIFFLANFTIDVILKILFFTLINMKVNFLRAENFLKNLQLQKSRFNNKTS